jgi:hypothetical protein
LNDPICLIFGSGSKLPRTELARTEYILETKTPHFTKPITLKYDPNDDTVLEFRLYDIDYLAGEEVFQSGIDIPRSFCVCDLILRTSLDLAPFLRLSSPKTTFSGLSKLRSSPSSRTSTD